MAERFIPEPTPETQTFWDKARLGELWLPKCVQTGRVFFPPRASSPFTGGPVSWERASGRASLASYVIVHRPAPGFEEGPYIVAIVALEEGPHMLTNLPGTSPEPAGLPIGAPLELTFEQRGDVAIPQFRLVGSRI
ncbi:Zn-ribbon domain-containing OB-fold protein [Amycolatopsis pithecellobii]|uniref:DNA-binding protein n=1 Tax=Amycolatopsis pithecellobii TaxID=664692 RepID=A0A6N7YS04_9PSEU|nr:OB-fold domain-containing protein [Amycolatopsis pithecellobii]MTD54742.1 DNA-binding protein [Amycolatopsis pithecellobii]